MKFPKFFKIATGYEPYGYQCRLACGEKRQGETEEAWLSHGTLCTSRLINIQTGLGKTAAVVLAWLWNRVGQSGPDWPRRLVYCLPMRTLVEQTETEVNKWLSAHVLAWDSKPENRRGKVGLHILMGGEDAGEWDIYPEENAILIGTQDMLLSRALNRGYGMSRYRWPMHFGLLNNDCLWVMDETQLMGVGVETSGQLDGFRCKGKMRTGGACPTWWMSATLDDTRLATVDHPKPSSGWPTEKLNDAEQTNGRPYELITARKKLSSAAVALNSTRKGSYAKELAALIEGRHQPGTLTLVVVNRVARAREIFEVLTTGKEPLYEPEKVALIHSRFRPVDRERHARLLFGEGDRIVIATQAVEAGVDVSARLLVTELAPWSSLVQRMGRCNRRADIGDAQVLWVDIQPKDEKDELLLPYSKDGLAKSRAAIAPLTDASPRALRDVTVTEEQVVRPVIRRRDLMDLFDTTPDLCGQDLDVSRYIRDGNDNDMQLFWRSVEGDVPTDKEHPPQRDELCRVSVGDAAKFLDKKPRAWRWNPLSERWERAQAARPGAVYLVDAKSGGYNDAAGWTGESKDKPTPHPPQDGELPRYAGDRLTFVRQWQPLAAHTAQIVRETDKLAKALSLDNSTAAALHAAALWHDTGKAHEEFQAMLVGNDTSRQDTLWAKSDNKNGKCRRLGFRHELASALAWLLKAPADAAERDLVGYLIAAHHGKVRLSIRSLPGEQGNPEDSEGLFARGIWHGDKLPPIPGIIAEPITLDLSFMQMGEGPHGPSWLARTVALRDRIGPFHLAFLETVLRAADARASRETTS